MPPINEEFDDPQLKLSLQRLYAHPADAATGRLAASAFDTGAASAAKSQPEDPRVEQSTSVAALPAMRIGPRRAIWKSAAAVLLAVGGAGLIGYQTVGARWLAQRAEAREHARAVALADQQKAALFGWMIIEQAADPPADAVVGGSLQAGDVAAAVNKVGQTLGRTMPGLEPTIGVWTLSRVSIVSFQQNRVARFDYVNGDRHAMFLSLPQSAAPNEGYDREYDVRFNDRAIAGYIGDGGLHCVVGDSQMTQPQAVAFRDAVRGKI